tara:strand:- start:863 stop:979 length:117 start_codon:yes stop_codon:yes gene_type:complete
MLGFYSRQNFSNNMVGAMMIKGGLATDEMVVRTTPTKL